MVLVTEVQKNYTEGIVWGYTCYNGMYGWIAIENTRVNYVGNSSPAEYDVVVTTPQYISLRKGPGVDFDEIYKPYNGQTLRIFETVTNEFDGRPWGRTTINGQNGWVSLNWTSRPSSATYNNARDTYFTNNTYRVKVIGYDSMKCLRANPDISSPVIVSQIGSTGAALLEVSTVYWNSRDNTVWGQTVYDGTWGWIAMSAAEVMDINNASRAGYYVSVNNSANIKLRKGPGTEYDLIIDYIPNGMSLYVTETVINSFDGRPWGKVNYNGWEGWVSLNWTYRAPGT